LQGVEDLGVDAEEEGFAVSHAGCQWSVVSC
jgi:hypothetical protein